MKSFSLFIILLGAFNVKAHTKPATGTKVLKGTGWLKNMTGLESCSWIIELDKEGKEKLEPLNLSNFKIKAVDGKKVIFTYVLSNVNSTCMAGKTVQLKSIKAAKDCHRDR